MTSFVDSSNMLKVSATCFGGGLAAGFLMNKIVNKLNSSSGVNNKAPEKWIQVGTVSQLILYPVKSLSGVLVNEAVLTPLGLTDGANPDSRDRVFLIVNSKGTFQTQRNIPRLARIKATVLQNILQLENLDNNQSSVAVPFPTDIQSNRKTVRIWFDKVEALDCGEDVAEWLSNFTGKSGLRLVYHDSVDPQRKLCKLFKAYPSYTSDDHGAFSDLTSFMLMTEESLSELNSMFSSPFSVKTFRPNILVKGSPEPWSEDFWSYIQIGEKGSDHSPILKASIPGLRCKLTTVNPDTGEFRDDGEPLKTLTRIKRKVGDELVSKMVENEAVMGTFFGLLQGQGLKIKVGDPVYAALL